MVPDEFKDHAELIAWRWLLGLERLDWESNSYTRVKQQILIQALPGELFATSGAPGVCVSISYPGLDGRVSGSGNSLFAACCRLHYYLKKRGIDVGHPQAVLDKAMYRLAGN